MADYKKISLKEMVGSREEDSYQETKFKISDDVQRKDIVEIGDAVFFEKVNFVFSNNRYVNALFINEIKNKEFSDIASSNNIKYDSIESSITLLDTLTDGYYYSSEITTDRNYKSDLNDFFLVVDEDVPAGCDILYYLITDTNKLFPLKPNATTPLKLNESIIKFKLKAELISNGSDSPKVRSYAILYFDKFVEDSIGLINPDLSELEEHGMNDIVTLIRDPANGDKLKEVISRLTTTKLTYDDGNNGRLSKVEEFRNIDSKKESENNLIYGDYVNSEGVTEDVLLQVSSKTTFKDE